MICLFCGQIRKGKTSLMTYCGIRNAQDTEKRQKMRAACKSLAARGFKVSTDKYALYSDYNIHYDNYHGEIINAQKINPLDIGSTLFIRPHSTLLISETQGYFNARRALTFTPKQALFFQTSGHFGVDIFLDCQDIETVDKTIRNLATIIEVKEKKIFDKAGKLTDYADARNFSRIEWKVIEYSGALFFDKQKGKEKIYKSNFNVFDCYNSFERFDNFLPIEKNQIII